VTTVSLPALDAEGPWADLGVSGRRDEPCIRVAEVTRSLDFYLDLGCEVRSAADGWVLLHCGLATFVLVQATPPAARAVPAPAPLRRPPRRRRGPRIAGSPQAGLRLTTSDVRALRRRLLAEGVPCSTIIRADPSMDGEIYVTDPDLNSVVIGQPAPVAGTTTRPPDRLVHPRRSA